MRQHSYTRRRSAGVEWLPQIPAHWNVVPLQHVVRLLSERNRPDLPLLSVYRDYGVILKSSRDDNYNRPGQDLSANKVVRPGDLVLNKMKTWQGSLGVSSVEGIVSPAYIVCRVSDGIYPRFLHYLVRSAMYVQEYNRLSYGVRPSQWDLHYEDFRALPCLVPPQNEQRTIAAFLDRETSQIDALIEEKERQIALLEEKRRALISHAVTKGLDPGVPMKPSGTEWLGRVPAHWEVKPFKHAVWFQEGPGIMASDFQNEGVPLLRIANLTPGMVSLDGCNYLDPDKVASKWDHFRLRLGDLLISCSATTGIVSEVGKAATGAIPYTGIIRLSPVAGAAVAGFVRYLVVSESYVSQVDALKSGVAIQHYGPTHLRQVVSAFPPLEEQEIIGAYLDRETGAIDDVVERVQASVEVLREYRAALVSATVTGQIDVREEVA